MTIKPLAADPRLERQLDQLGSAIRYVEEALKRLRLGVSATVPLTDETSGKVVLLGYGKLHDAWRLYVEHASGDRQPLAHTSQELRVLAAHRLPELHAALLTSLERRVDAVGGAVTAYRDFARDISPKLSPIPAPEDR